MFYCRSLTLTPTGGGAEGGGGNMTDFTVYTMIPTVHPFCLKKISGSILNIRFNKMFPLWTFLFNMINLKFPKEYSHLIYV